MSSIHHGRHSFIGHALAGGRTLAEVREAAGHANVRITSAYLHVAVVGEEVGISLGWRNHVRGPLFGHAFNSPRAIKPTHANDRHHALADIRAEIDQLPTLSMCLIPRL
jgi:hypothetical protein